MRVLVFGDSITQGFWDSNGGWVERLRKHYDAIQIEGKTGNSPTIFNLGISADKSADVLRRLESETIARTRHNSKPAIVVQVGINDSVIEQDQARATVDDYKKNLELIVETSRLVGSNLIFVGLSACNESETTPVFWGNYFYRNNHIKKYEDCLAEVASSKGILFVPIFDKFLEISRRQNILADGLHPNDSGHELIFQLVLEKLSLELRS